MALTKNAKGQFAKPNTGQSKHFVKHPDFAIGPTENTINAWHTSVTVGAAQLKARPVEMVSCVIYGWRRHEDGPKLVATRKIDRPRTLVSNYRGHQGLPKGREGDYELLDEAFSLAPDTAGFQAPESILRRLLEQWVTEHAEKCDGQTRLKLARAFSLLMATRAGASLAVGSF